MKKIICLSNQKDDIAVHAFLKLNYALNLMKFAVMIEVLILLVDTKIVICFHVKKMFCNMLLVKNGFSCMMVCNIHVAIQLIFLENFNFTVVYKFLWSCLHYLFGLHISDFII